MEKRHFSYMNQDMEPRLLPDGAVPFVLNGRMGNHEADGGGSLENERGNRKVDFTLGAGVNTCIGKYEDERSKRIFYFVHNSIGNHKILQYDINLLTITELIGDSLLAFNASNLITGVAMVDGQYLVWTDDLNEPSFLDVDLANGAGYPSPFLRDYIALNPKPPFCPPVPFYGTENEKQFNNLRGSLWEFRYRWVYTDGRKSVWSAPSKVPLPEGESLDDPIATNNYIDIGLTTGGVLVTDVEVSVRQGNNSDFFFFNSFNKTDESWADDTTEQISFYNDSVLTALDLTDSNNLYNRIPRWAKALTNIEGNRIAFGNITENFDLPTLDVETIPVYTAQPTTNSPTIIKGVKVTPTNALYFEIGADVEEGNKFSIDIHYDVDLIAPPTSIVDRQVTFTYTAQAGDDRNDVADALAAQINAYTVEVSGSDVVTAYPFSAPLATSPVMTTGQVVVTANAIAGTTNTTSLQNESVTTFIKSTTTFKDGAFHEFALVYFDDYDRSSPALTNDDLRTYVNFVTENVVNERGEVDIEITINHLPPSWATKYMFYHTGNTTYEKFLWVTTSTVNNPATNTYEISLDSLVAFNDENDNSVLSYTFSEGDRMRLIEDSTGAYYNQMIDVPILKEDSGLLTIETTASNVGAGMLVEIYTPRKTTEEKLFYSTGDCYAINNGFHVGRDQNQTAMQPAITSLKAGDVYQKSRTMQVSTGPVVKDTFIVHEANFSDFYASADYSKGRPNAVSPGFSEVNRPTTVYYTEPFIPDTNINGLGTVYDLNFEEYNRDYGSIQLLYPENKRLLLLQELKVGYALVFEVVYSDVQGGNTVGASENILSKKAQYYHGEYGIANNPESFAVYGYWKFFTDKARGAVIKLDEGGVHNIADNGMQSYWTKSFEDANKHSEMLTGFIFGGVHPRFGEYIVSHEKPYEISGALASTLEAPPGTFNETITIDPTQFSVNDSVKLVFESLTAGGFKKIDGTVTQVNSDNIVVQQTVISLTTDAGVGNQVDVVVVKKETISFRYKGPESMRLKWSSFWSYLPEMISSAGIGMVTWRDGEIWLHNQSTTYSNFYDTQYTLQIHVISNENGSNEKVFKSLQVESNEKFSVPVITNDIQESDLIENDFVKRETFFYATIRRDKNTAGVTYPLLNGDVMRGPYMRFEMECDATTAVRLISVGINHFHSMRSNA